MITNTADSFFFKENIPVLTFTVASKNTSLFIAG